jgi:predicted enzyme related to lactoylglutathione lyase
MPAKKAARPSPTPPTVPKAQFWSVAVLVSDRKKATDWYTKNFGLDVVEEMDHWVAVGRAGQNGLLHLCQTSDWMGKELLEAGNQGIMFHLPGDFRAACAALASNGVKFSQPPSEEPWGWTATVVDPDGNEITLGPSA